jgi:hypothetical protein
MSVLRASMSTVTLWCVPGKALCFCLSVNNAEMLKLEDRDNAAGMKAEARMACMHSRIM